MPRSKVGVHHMRVQHGDTVYILTHRIPFVAWRNQRWSENKRQCLLQLLYIHDHENETYTIEKCFHTAATGLFKAYSSREDRMLLIHHRDAVRV